MYFPNNIVFCSHLIIPQTEVILGRQRGAKYLKQQQKSKFIKHSVGSETKSTKQWCNTVRGD